MKRIVNAETLEVVDPQIAYLDGYALAERLLEGVLFEIHLDTHGNPVCTGVTADCAEYMEKFSAKQMTKWCNEAATEFHLDQLTDRDGQIDLYIEDVE